ncbi:MAG: hypothetical protein II287_08145, partial [Bacteroidaceae bacterium]|nr:hypothetical protein [Bacteroidaceae bacterium]
MAKNFVTLAEAMPAFFEKCLTVAERDSCSLQDFMISNGATLNHYLYILTREHLQDIDKNPPSLSGEELTEIFRRAYLMVNRIISAAGLESTANNQFFDYKTKDYVTKNEILEAYTLFILEHLDSGIFNIYLSENSTVRTHNYLYLRLHVSLGSMTKETMWLLLTEQQQKAPEPEQQSQAPAEAPVTEPPLTDDDIIKLAVQALLAALLANKIKLCKKHWFAVYKVVKSRNLYVGPLTVFCKKIEEWGFVTEKIYECAKKNTSLPTHYDKWADYINKASDADK